MTMRSLLLCTTALTACATAGGEPAGVDASAGNHAEPDAGVSVTHPDAATASCAFSGMLASWSLTGQPGSQSATASSSTANGVTAGSVSRSGALTATSGLDSMNSSNWPTAAQLDATKYYTFTITPPPGCALTATSLAVDAKSSTTGPATAVVATSADGFASTVPVSTSAPSTPSISATTSGPLEIRLYGYAASGTSGTMRVQNALTVTGTLE